MIDADFLLTHAGQLVRIAGPDGDDAPRRERSLSDLHILADGSLAARDGQIVWVGPTATVATEVRLSPSGIEIDAHGRVVTPGLVDAHTHPVFAGQRAAEFAQRLAGESYMEIAQAGGGIASTVRQTRAATEDELSIRARSVADWMLRSGTTTAEAKSGYGLNLDDELKMLRVIRRINAEHAIDWVATALPAHEIPPEFRNRPDDYVTLIVDEILPAIAREHLAEFNDVFLEKGVFDRTQTERIQIRARALGFGLKFHADELSDTGGAALAVQMGAVSADHLVYISDGGIAALADSDTIAVLLPGTVYTLDLPRKPPVRRMIEAGVAVALATDCNPGSNMTESMPQAMNQACVLYKMTPEEALVAATYNAAHSMRRADRIGALTIGRQCDLVVWDVHDYRELPYHYGVNLASQVVKKGRVVFSS